MRNPRTHIVLDPELKQQLSTLCYKNSTSISKVARQLLTEWIKEQNNKQDIQVELTELPSYPPLHLIK
jgi:predicted transcriptional regulator